MTQVEAEELSDISEEYGVSAVPFFAILKVTPALVVCFIMHLSTTHLTTNVHTPRHWCIWDCTLLGRSL